MGDFTDLIIYKKAFSLAMDIYRISQRFPADEKYSLTNQIRRSSRSVCANFAEAYRRRNYKAFFVSKLTECAAENAETLVWLQFAKECTYSTLDEYNDLHMRNQEVSRLLRHMIQNPEKFI